MNRISLAIALVASLALPASAASVLTEVDQAAGRHVVPGKKVLFETTKGKFTIVLFPKEAPKTVANFEKLVNQHFYDGLTFHRVIPGFVVQGGDPKGTGEGGPGWSIPDENNSLKHIPGALAMAKSAAPNSAGSQFYLALERLKSLDGRYTVFGQVLSGMEVVRKIQPTETDAGPTGKKPDRMIRVRLMR